MTREEAVKKLVTAGRLSVAHAEDFYDSIIPKPVVPQYVVNWVDNSREYDYEFCDFFDCNNQSEEVYKWLNCKNRRESEINALALITLIVNGSNAVEVEQEKLYTVEIPNPNSKSYMNVLKRVVDGIIIETVWRPSTSYFKHKDFQLTESEIKQDFEWAWQFAEEVEEETRYTVRIRNLDDEETYLNYDKFRETWVFYSQGNTDRFRTIHTRKELEEAGFGWVFDCEGIVIEEVE